MELSVLPKVWRYTPAFFKGPVRRTARVVLTNARRRRVVSSLKPAGIDENISAVLGFDVLSVDAFDLPLVFERLEEVVSRTTSPSRLRNLSKAFRSQSFHRSSGKALARLKELERGELPPGLAVDEAESLVVLGDRQADAAIQSALGLGPEALGLKATKRVLSIASGQVSRTGQPSAGGMDFLEAACQAFPFDLEVITRAEQLRARTMERAQERTSLPQRLDESIDALLEATGFQVRIALQMSDLLAQYEPADSRILQLRRAALSNALLNRDLASALLVVPRLEQLQQTEIDKLHSLIRACKDPKTLAQSVSGNNGRGRGVAADGAAVLDAAAHRAQQYLSESGEHRADKLLPVVTILLRRDVARAIELARRVPTSGMNRSIAVAHLLGRAFVGQSSEAHPALRQVALENPSDNIVWNALRFVAVRAHGPSGDDIAFFEALEMPGPIPGWVQTTRQHLGHHTPPDGYRAQADAVILTMVDSSGTRFFSRTERPALEQLAGKAVLLLSDNGVSDEIRFYQDLRAIQSVAKSVTATCDPRAIGLLSRGFPKVDFVPFRRHSFIEGRDRADQSDSDTASESPLVPLQLREMSAFDVVLAQATLADLRLVEKKWDTRHGGRYLVPDPAAFDTRPVNDLPGLRIGLQWRSGSMQGFRPFMYPPLAALAPLLGIPGASFVNLQHMLTEEEHQILEQYGVTMLNLDLYEDFEAIATVADLLDLVIGSSSLPMELAAAVGTEVWMLGFNPENYYLRTRGGTTEQDILTWNSTIIGPENPRKAFLAGDDVSLALSVERVRERIEERIRQERDRGSSCSPYALC